MEKQSEVHIVGGVHPKMGLHYFAQLIKSKRNSSRLACKSLYSCGTRLYVQKAKVSYEEGLSILKAHGQGSLPGGGAEIFDETIRAQIAGDKCTAANGSAYTKPLTNLACLRMLPCCTAMLKVLKTE